MESTAAGHPGVPKRVNAALPILEGVRDGEFALTFESEGLRAKAMLQRMTRE